MQGVPAASDVLRGVAVQGAPLRLGRARASVAPAPAASSEGSAREQALEEARSLAIREAREQGLREGRTEGLREGRAQAAEEVRLAVQRAVADAVLPLEKEHAQLLQIAQSARQAIGDALTAAQDEMAALCFETLCRILGATAVRPEAVQAQLAQLLQQHGAKELVLHLHPQDAQLLDTRAGARLHGTTHWVADPEVRLGGCILQLPGGGLDARLETMLSACKAALLEARCQSLQPDDARERQ
jgi:flagellar assembly protein FliH